MHDARVQLVIIISFFYLLMGMFDDCLSTFFAAPAATAYLRSLSPTQLTVESTGSMQDRQEAGQSLPAVHAPFFFQAVPINSADKEMLMTVKGIGSSLAESIISSRRDHGPFKSAEDLTRIPGVGTKRANSLASLLVFDEVP